MEPQTGTLSGTLSLLQYNPVLNYPSRSSKDNLGILRPGSRFGTLFVNSAVHANAILRLLEAEAFAAISGLLIFA